MNQPIIGVSGLRGVVGVSLNPALVIDYCAAFVSQLPPGPVLLARDGRSSGTMLADAIASGLRACGRAVLYADVAATPTVGILVQQHGAVGGVQISASHNPPEYNGIKLFGANGRVISAAAGERVREAFERREIQWAAHDQLGTVQQLQETTAEHLQRVLSTVDAANIRRRKFKVVLDSNHGAGSILARKLFGELGVEYRILGESPDGQFEHPPEPTVDNLQSVAAQAISFGADVVFCQDPDADRLAVIDEKGRYIGEEYTLAIALRHRLRQQPGPVVINCATSRMSAEIAQELSSAVHLSAVGEANVTSKMDEVGAVYGGEGNGGPIDPKVGYVRDSFVAMAQILDCLAAENSTVSALVATLPRYAIHKTTIKLERSRIPAWIDELEKHNREAGISRLDGLRLDWPDRWLLVRPSNTEPIVRAIAEARNEPTAKALCEMAARMA